VRIPARYNNPRNAFCFCPVPNLASSPHSCCFTCSNQKSCHLSALSCLPRPTPTALALANPRPSQTLSVLPPEWAALPKLRVKCRIRNFAPAHSALP
jgi:hypothetical protein